MVEVGVGLGVFVGGFGVLVGVDVGLGVLVTGFGVFVGVDAADARVAVGDSGTDVDVGVGVVDENKGKSSTLPSVSI